MDDSFTHIDLDEALGTSTSTYDPRSWHIDDQLAAQLLDALVQFHVVCNNAFETFVANSASVDFKDSALRSQRSAADVVKGRISGLVSFFIRWHSYSRENIRDLVYRSAACAKSLRIIRECNDMVTALNRPERLRELQSERQIETALIVSFLTSKYDRIILFHRQAHSAVQLLINDDQHFTQRDHRDALDSLDEQWEHLLDQVRTLEQATKNRVKEPLRWRLSPSGPEYRDLLFLEQDVSELLDQFEAMIDSMPEPKAWTAHDFSELRSKMDAPTKIDVDMAAMRQKGEDRTLEESQIIDNKCHICLKKYTDHTSIRNGCSHMFCFECIVPWIDANKECAKCRAKVILHDLVRLDVRVVEDRTAEELEDDNDEEDQELMEMWERQSKLQADLNEVMRLLEGFKISK